MNVNNPKIHFVVDASNIMHRFVNVGIKFKGLDTKEKLFAHIDNFANDIIKNIFSYRDIMGKDKSFELENMIFVFDQASWRKDFMGPGEYKAGRDTSKSETINLLTERLIEVCNEIGISTIKEEKMEADDPIALFVKKNSLENPNDIRVILSNDDDFSSLLELPNTHIYNGINHTWNNKEGSLALIQKILLGDDSDSIPRPYQLLEFENEIVNLTYGPKEILNNLNGKFVCDCPNGVTMTLEKSSELLELSAFSNNEKTIIFSSNKSSIAFDDNLRLSSDMKFKFDKSVPKDEQARISKNATLVLSQMAHYLQDGKFQPAENINEDFASFIVKKYIEKFKSVYQGHLRTNDTELSLKDARAIVADTLPKVIYDNNSSFFTSKPNDIEEVESFMIDHFMKNVRRNDMLINFDNIPVELVEVFETKIYPSIFSKETKSLKEISEYLISQKFFSANKALSNPPSTNLASFKR